MKHLIFALLLASPASAQTIAGHIVGDVSLDPTNLDRVLSVKLYDHGTYLSEAIPDGNGNFYFTQDEHGTPLRAGQYTVRASGGFRLTKWATVATNTPATIKMLLNPVLLDGSCSIEDNMFTCNFTTALKAEYPQEKLQLLMTADVILPGLTSNIDARIGLPSQRVNLGSSATFTTRLPVIPAGFPVCLDARIGVDQAHTYRQFTICATR